MDKRRTRWRTCILGWILSCCREGATGSGASASRRSGACLRNDVQTLGQRVQAMAHLVNAHVTPAGCCPYAAYGCLGTGHAERVPGLDHERVNERRSEEHTSELQSLRHLVCRLLL